LNAYSMGITALSRRCFGDDYSYFAYLYDKEIILQCVSQSTSIPSEYILNTSERTWITYC